MGEAFDRTGAFLGAVQADSMREVLDKLQEAHPHASEFRIRSLEETLDEKEQELQRAGRPAT